MRGCNFRQGQSGRPFRKGTTPLKNGLTVAQTVKCRITPWPSKSSPRSVPKRNETVRPHENLGMNVQNRMIRNGQEVELSPMSSSW